MPNSAGFLLYSVHLRGETKTNLKNVVGLIYSDDGQSPK
jgi:hypothetical protein